MKREALTPVKYKIKLSRSIHPDLLKSLTLDLHVAKQTSRHCKRLLLTTSIKVMIFFHILRGISVVETKFTVEAT